MKIYTNYFSAFLECRNKGYTEKELDDMTISQVIDLANSLYYRQKKKA